MTDVAPGLGSGSAFTGAGGGCHLFLVHSFLKNNFIYLFILFALRFHCCMGFFLVMVSGATL